MQGDVAVVLVDDLLAQGQSDARTVWLGGVERDEDALLCFHGDALSVVLHADLHFVFGRVPAQVDFFSLSGLGDASRALVIRLIKTCSIWERSAWNVKPR